MDTEILVASLATELRRDPRDVKALMDGFVSTMREALVDGDTVLLPGFGTFSTVKEDEKVVDDLAGGGRLLLPPAITVTFTPSTLLRRKIVDRP